MVDPREQIWANAFNAALHSCDPEQARLHADRALETYERCWPANRDVISIQAHDTLVREYSGRLLGDIRDWAHENVFGRAALLYREDATNVIQSFVRALSEWKVDQSSGPSWDVPPPVPVPSIDVPMLQRALAQLLVDGRTDAHKVLSHLVSKLGEAQEQGKKLVDWGPPARGA